MTARPSRPELRHSILARLSSFTEEVEWNATGAHIAYADSVIAWADWLANCTEPPPPAGDGGSDAARAAALTACAEAVKDAKTRRTGGGR